MSTNPAIVPYTMPDVSPLYPPLPYTYTHYRKLTIVGRARERDLARYLPAPLDLADDRFEIFFMDAPEVDGLRPYAEAGVVLRVRYQDRVGGHVTFEYVTTDDSLAAGREIWGYPKKIAAVRLWDEDGKVRGTCSREGQHLASATFTPEQAPFDGPVMHPRLQVKRIPSAEPKGSPTGQIVWNELRDVVTRSLVYGSASLELGEAMGDDLRDLRPTEIIGGHLVAGSFVLDHGRIVGVLP